MTGWTAVALVLLAALVPCGVAALRGDVLDRLVGLEQAGVVLVLLLIALALRAGQPAFLDLAVALALLTCGGGLVFARVLERWL